MKTLDIYDLTLTQLNREGSGFNIELEKSNFVILFNKVLSLWFAEKLNAVDAQFETENLQLFLVPDKKLEFIGTGNNFYRYTLPSNMFDSKRNSCYCVAEKEKCVRRLYIETIHFRNQNLALANSMTKPSFAWEETFGVLANDELLVYHDDFEIKHLFFSYYREPKKIGLDYQAASGEFMKYQDTDLPDLYVYHVVDRLVAEVLENRQDVTGTQIMKTRTGI